MINRSIAVFLALLVAGFSLPAQAETVNYKIRDTQDLFTYLVRIEKIPAAELPQESAVPGTIFIRVAYEDTYKKRELGFQRVQITEDIRLTPTGKKDDFEVETRVMSTDLYRGRHYVAHIQGNALWRPQTATKDFYLEIWNYAQEQEIMTR